jgi:hypothetical protein
MGFLPKAFFEERFENDVTMFAYRDNLGIWPGYILKLKEGQTPLGLTALVQQIEKDPALLAPLYATSTGALAGTFRDTQIAGQPVRRVSFAQNAVFIYGWFYNQYLVLGTSDEGVKQAVQRL